MSPSKMPFLARPLPRSSVNWAVSAPASSKAFTWLKNSFLIKRVGASFFNASMVPPSSVSNTRCLNAGWAEDSVATAKRVPICTPSAPRVMAATTDFPEDIPPAAITGREQDSTTLGIKVSVVVSSRPLCPPASNPSATTAFTPASSHFFANSALLITCTTVMPCDFNKGVHFFGFPAEVKTILTPSWMIISISRSISG